MAKKLQIREDNMLESQIEGTQRIKEALESCLGNDWDIKTYSQDFNWLWGINGSQQVAQAGKNIVIIWDGFPKPENQTESEKLVPLNLFITPINWALANRSLRQEIRILDIYSHKCSYGEEERTFYEKILETLDGNEFIFYSFNKRIFQNATSPLMIRDAAKEKATGVMKEEAKEKATGVMKEEAKDSYFISFMKRVKGWMKISG